MDDKWRTISCPSCGGFGMTWNPEAWDGIDYCGCNEGTLWIRPKGHTFEYPSGRATGMWDEKAYARGTPVMPYDWHSWDHTEEEIDSFILDRNGSFDVELNVVKCTCKEFTGTIKEFDLHHEEKKQQFIAEHRSVA